MDLEVTLLEQKLCLVYTLEEEVGVEVWEMVPQQLVGAGDSQVVE